MEPSPATAAEPAGRAARRPSAWWGLVITLAGWAILAYPAFMALLATAAAFSGCFLVCTEPKPAAGTAGVVILAAMVVCPPLLGVAVVRGGRKWWIALGACALAVIAAVIFGAV